MKFRLPKIPFIGEKIILKRSTLEDDENPCLYQMKLTGVLPERIVKTIYNYTIKPKTRVSFVQGLRDGSSIDVPTEFFKHSAGLDNWQETILKQLSRHFHEVHNKLGWIFITRSLNLMRITRKGNEYYILLEVTGEKQ